MRGDLFLDMAFAIALSIETDAFHDKKEWGLTDCLSFVVMQEMNITGALTTDRHFEQAGFSALMRAA